MSSNLPPGVTPGMIPGNRPEDEWWETFYEAFEPPSWVMEYVAPTEAAGLIVRMLEAFSQVERRAFGLGKNEGVMQEHEYQRAREEGES